MTSPLDPIPLPPGLRAAEPDTAAYEAAVREQRLADFGITDAPRPDLDEAAAALGRAAGAAYAMVNRIGERQTFIGLYRAEDRPDLPIVTRTMTLEEGYCPSLLRRSKNLVLPDVYAIARFKSNPVVDQIGIRAYAGARITDPRDGLVLGTVCLVDTRPRPESTENELAALITEHCAGILPLLRLSR
ncbi:GAF domain-containing protein [Streptomyces amakusaensis]|uniref:GAF domain-containing protein n=1 Tax=Streptomyces amakusaensis TaxID=67271 RepID=A0ABW0AK99_9ACTN